MPEKRVYQHWICELDSDNILWLHFDKANESTNTIDGTVLTELNAILDNLQSAKPRAIIIASAKKNGFIAGADIRQFPKLKTQDETFTFIRGGQQVFDKLASLKIPTVAMIHGFCLGGGLELALACRYRVAEDGPKTRLGLPEVLLGIQPGWGGTIRLPHVIGTLNAMDLILSGRTVTARAAAKLGLVDAAVPQRQLERAAREYALNTPTPKKAGFLYGLLNHVWVRPLIGKLLYRKLNQKIRRDHYPAPYAIVDNWIQYGIDGDDAMLQEAKSLAALHTQDTARNLVRVFFLQERLKNVGATLGSPAHAPAPSHIHVIGAGTMGGGIAAWCALRGLRVSLQDEPAAIAKAMKSAYDLFVQRLKLPRLVQEAMDRLMPDPEGVSVPKADVVVEAIYENLEAKQNLFKSLEARVRPDAILATNTSSIPLDEINAVLKHPKRLVGIHFFNPVPKMLLVEVVQGAKTDPEVVKQATAFVRSIDKLPVPVKSEPGFLVNRMLMPYLMEAMTMLEEGVPAQAIDKAALDFGMPMGPILLADTVGLDVCLYVAENLAQHYNVTIPARLREMVDRRELGVKIGKGFYNYRNGKPIKNTDTSESSVSQDRIADRLILRMLNEAVACLREKIVADKDLLDAGMIFGTGFAPFRGGPMHYVDTVGKQQILDRLQILYQQLGDRFKPDAGWEKL